MEPAAAAFTRVVYVVPSSEPCSVAAAPELLKNTALKPGAKGVLLNSCAVLVTVRTFMVFSCEKARSRGRSHCVEDQAIDRTASALRLLVVMLYFEVCPK